MPFGMLSELKFAAHLPYKVDSNINNWEHTAKSAAYVQTWLSNFITQPKNKMLNECVFTNKIK